MFINSPYSPDYGNGKERIRKMLGRAMQERKKAREALLPPLLAALPEKASVLTRQQWDVLYDVLYDRRRNPNSQGDEACLLVLQALEHYADTANLDYLSFWGDTVAFLWANEEGAVSEAASRCLPLLQARLNKEK